MWTAYKSHENNCASKITCQWGINILQNSERRSYAISQKNCAKPLSCSMTWAIHWPDRSFFCVVPDCHSRLDYHLLQLLHKKYTKVDSGKVNFSFKLSPDQRPPTSFRPVINNSNLFFRTTQQSLRTNPLYGDCTFFAFCSSAGCFDPALPRPRCPALHIGSFLPRLFPLFPCCNSSRPLFRSLFANNMLFSFVAEGPLPKQQSHRNGSSFGRHVALRQTKQKHGNNNR